MGVIEEDYFFSSTAIFNFFNIFQEASKKSVRLTLLQWVKPVVLCVLQLVGSVFICTPSNLCILSADCKQAGIFEGILQFALVTQDREPLRCHSASPCIHYLSAHNN